MFLYFCGITVLNNLAMHGKISVKIIVKNESFVYIFRSTFSDFMTIKFGSVIIRSSIDYKVLLRFDINIILHA